METIIKTLKGKYIVNMLMIGIFAALAFSGLFHRGDGEHHSRSGFRSEQLHYRGDKVPILEQGTERDFFRDDSMPMQREGGMDFHTIAGLIWLFLMLFHIWQHWNWFKKMFSFQHIRKNKLLTITILVFILLACSGVSLAFDLIPRGVFNVKEVHEFLGQSLGVLVIIHCIQRYKWIVSTTRNLVGRFRLSVSNA
jgi:hypothetical protein